MKEEKNELGAEGQQHRRRWASVREIFVSCVLEEGSSCKDGALRLVLRQRGTPWHLEGDVPRHRRLVPAP